MSSRLLSGTAMTLLRAAVAWHVFDLSGSAFQLGLIGLVQFVPSAAFSLLGGAVADSFDRRRIAMLAQLAPLACASVLYLATSQGWIELPLIYGLLFLIASAAAFENPARSALLPSLVPRAVFPNAVTVHSTGQALAFMSGPMACGFAIYAGGVAAAYALHLGLMAASLSALAALRVPAWNDQRFDKRALSVRAIREGLAFVRRQRVVLGCMTLDMFAVVFGGATVLLPIYANEILAVGPRGYGLLTAALEIGAVLMSLLLVMLPPIRRAGAALLVSVGVYGLATVAFGLSRWFPLSLAAYVLVGMADQVSVVMRQTTIQLSTPDELRGRVSSINMIFIGASNQLGAVESGFVAALTSATFSVVSGGLGCLAVLAWVAARLPELRHYRSDRPPAAEAAR